MKNHTAKIKDKVRLEFIGGNATQVTGSSILGTFKGVNFLLELGMVQGEHTELENYRANWDILHKIDFSKIDYIFLAHGHIDHGGLIAHALTHRDFHGRIICTYETKHVLKPLIEDSCHIIKDNCEWLRNTKGIRAVEYYKDKDVEPTMNRIDTYNLNEIYKLTNNFSFKLIPNNHILGSSSIILYFKDDLNITHTLFYSSDLGNTAVDKFFVYDDLSYCKKANIAIFESTYGGITKKAITPKMRKNDVKEMKDNIIHTILEKQGNVLLPSFALDRQENLLVYLKQIIESDERLFDVQVIVDGKLSSKIIKVYNQILQGEQKEQFDDILNWQNLKIVSNFEQTKMILADEKPKIVCSSSGMCTNGHIVEYLKRYLTKDKNTIIFTGYCSDSLLGGKIKSKQQSSVKIDKCVYPIKADVVDLHSFSSHMQRTELLDYCMDMKVSDSYVLVHGDKECKESLAEELENRLRKNNRTTKVISSKKGMVIYF
jgi:metallo-beta-lactamase family protein